MSQGKHKSGRVLELPGGVTLLERGWLSSNNVVLQGREGTAIVDTGYVSHAPQTTALVEGALDGRPLDLLLNSHLHSDHCGGNAALQERWPLVRTLVPPEQERKVAEWDVAALTYQPTGQHCPRFVANGVLRPGTTMALGGQNWLVMPAPGHDPHSVMFFQPDTKLLLSADALWENGFGVVFPELSGEAAFGEVAATLDLIESCAPSVVIPGHGAAFDDITTALAHARSRLESYRRSPDRHAAHAAKVLLKFKLLDWRVVSMSELQRWAASTEYLLLIHRRWAPRVGGFDDWLIGLVDALVGSGVVIRQGEMLTNE